MSEHTNNPLPFARCFRDDVLHRHLTDGRLRVEVVFVHLATEALQLRLDVILRTMDTLGCGRARANCNQLRDVIEGLIAIKAASLSGRRSWLRMRCLNVEGWFRVALRRLAGALLRRI